MLVIFQNTVKIFHPFVLFGLCVKSVVVTIRTSVMGCRAEGGPVSNPGHSAVGPIKLGS